MILLLDNRDSFTFNLEHALRAAGVPVDDYGEGSAKRVADLYWEIDTGSSRLEWQHGNGP